MIDRIPQQAVNELRKSLSEKRYNHSVGVMETAFLLADSWKNHPVNKDGLAWASLFHDCGKEIPKNDRKALCANDHIVYGKELLDIGKLNHAPLGAMLLQEKYHISDPEILKAVAYHPTGHIDLDPIGWIVYIADFLEPGRTYMPNREQNLKQACNDPLQGLRIVTQMRIATVLQKNKNIHPVTEEFKQYIDSLTKL